MCCFAQFITKYVLFFANLVFTLAGLALIVIGIVTLVQINEILETLPVNLNAIPIAVIVLGSIIFSIAFFGCCGAIRESKCLLNMYTVCMLILAAGKIYLATVIFGGLRNLQKTVEDWVNTAFKDTNLSKILEVAFQCCGTTGPEWYTTDLPLTCCANPVGDVCPADIAYGGCVPALNDYLTKYGEAIGGVIVTIIVVEFVAAVFSIFLTCSASRKQRV